MSARAEALRKKAREIEAAERKAERLKDAATIPTCEECGGRVFKISAYTVVSQSIDYEDDPDGDWDDDYESGDHTDVNESAECRECGADAEEVLTRHGWTFYHEPQPVEKA